MAQAARISGAARLLRLGAGRLGSRGTARGMVCRMAGADLAEKVVLEHGLRTRAAAASSDDAISTVLLVCRRAREGRERKDGCSSEVSRVVASCMSCVLCVFAHPCLLGIFTC